MVHPMQYDLERAYHFYRQQAAAQQRQVAEAERHNPTPTLFARLANTVSTRLHFDLLGTDDRRVDVPVFLHR